MAKSNNIIVDTDGDAITPNAGVKAKGATPNATAGQILASANAAKSAVFGSTNVKAIYMKKKTATGWEFEAVDYSKIGEMITAGYSLAGAGKPGNRSFDLTGATGLSKDLYCKVHSTVTVGWKQSSKVYNKVSAAARTKFGQTETPAAAKEVARGANYFVFSTDWNAIPAGTVIQREALKARVRYAEATETNSGVYHSYCQETVPA